MRTVGAQDGMKLRDTPWVAKLSFWDAKGERICEYNPNDSSLEQVKHQIKENEQLIGVYGVKGMDDKLYSFGFMVRSRKKI